MRRVRAGLLIAVRQDLDLYVVEAGIVVEVAFVDAEKQGTVAGGGEFAFGADVDEIVIVVADDGNQGSGSNVFQKFLRVFERGNAGWSRAMAFAEVYLALAGDAYPLSFFDNPAGICPAVGCIVRKHLYIPSDRFRGRGWIGLLCRGAGAFCVIGCDDDRRILRGLLFV